MIDTTPELLALIVVATICLIVLVVVVAVSVVYVIRSLSDDRPGRKVKPSG